MPDRIRSGRVKMPPGMAGAHPSGIPMRELKSLKQYVVSDQNQIMPD